MAELLTQEQIEERMYMGGIARATASMTNAEERGAAFQNPYAKEIFRDYVMPIGSAIAQELNYSGAGGRKAHIALLRGLDPEAVAFLAIRAAVGNLLSADAYGHSKLAYTIGRTINRELVLTQFEMQNPELYHTLARDFARRLTKDERHRLVVFKQQAEKAGIKVTEWPLGAFNQVGSYLLELMETAGLITIDENQLRVGYLYKQRPVHLHPDVVDRINQIKSYVAITSPVYGPCVEPPKDWGFGIQGGFHTKRMAMRQSLVHASSACRELVRNTDMPVVYAAVNALQRTAWKVNVRMLDTILEIAKNFHTKEIVSLVDSPKPQPPEWLVKGQTKEEMTEQQLAQFLQWKREASDWHTERKIIGARYGRFYAATRAAEFFRDYPAIYFAYFADSRGRLYPMTQGINPQGSDLGKSLLHFAKGHPVSTPESLLWFKVQGANKWGFDKATLQDRAKWVDDHQVQIMMFAEDPINNVGWLEAGDPLQFLAWCYEYRDWFYDDGTFVSHLPISMDGSCNGLQNLSAMFRDSIGGKATNLTNNEVMEDIYASVAKAAEKRLRAMVFDDPAQIKAQQLWLEHGINRKVVKRSVMTTPYGVTLRTATEYVIDDYLRQGLGPTFDKTEYRTASTILMKAVWPAIGDVVVKGREAMDWLKKSSRIIVKQLPPDAEPIIKWRTPSGFPASQAYFESAAHRIKTQLHGTVVIKALSETDKPDATAHASGLAPNFVHSMDAAHLHLTTAEAAKEGIEDLAMIHDDYGCHAAFAPKFYEIIRRQFVAMYLGFDAVVALCEDYEGLPPPPDKGDLDIMEVLESQYFFS